MVRRECAIPCARTTTLRHSSRATRAPLPGRGRGPRPSHTTSPVHSRTPPPALRQPRARFRKNHAERAPCSSRPRAVVTPPSATISRGPRSTSGPPVECESRGRHPAKGAAATRSRRAGAPGTVNSAAFLPCPPRQPGRLGATRPTDSLTPGRAPPSLARHTPLTRNPASLFPRPSPPRPLKSAKGTGSPAVDPEEIRSCIPPRDFARSSGRVVAAPRLFFLRRSFFGRDFVAREGRGQRRGPEASSATSPAGLRMQLTLTRRGAAGRDGSSDASHDLRRRLCGRDAGVGALGYSAGGGSECGTRARRERSAAATGVAAAPRLPSPGRVPHARPPYI